MSSEHAVIYNKLSMGSDAWLTSHDLQTQWTRSDWSSCWFVIRVYQYRFVDAGLQVSTCMHRVWFVPAWLTHSHTQRQTHRQTGTAISICYTI